MKTKSIQQAYPTKYYWDCCNNKHHHTTETIANNCITRHNNAMELAKPKAAISMTIHRRRKYVVLEVCKGRTITEIAKELNYATETISRDIRVAFRLLAKDKRVIPLIPEEYIYELGEYGPFIAVYKTTDLRKYADLWRYIFDVYYPDPGIEEYAGQENTLTMYRTTKQLTEK